MKRKIRGFRNARVNPNQKDNRPQERDESTQKRESQLMKIIEQARAEWDELYPKSRLKTSRGPCRLEIDLCSRTYVHKTVENLMEDVINKLDSRAVDIFEQIVVDTLKIL